MQAVGSYVAEGGWLGSRRRAGNDATFCSLRRTDPAVAADMGPRPAWSLAYPERDSSQLRQ